MGSLVPHPVIDNLKGIRRRIVEAARRAGRDPDGVELAAVTKFASEEAVRELIREGSVRWFGENRVQNARLRRDALGPEAGRVGWRFIGHLQTNKAKQALETFDSIDSLESLRLAEALEKRLRTEGRRLPVLIQVKLTGKETQSGVEPGELGGFLKQLEDFPSIDARGLMAIAPMLEPVEAVRPFFRQVREVFERHFPERTDGARRLLSLGMSRDFEVAIEEGANLVRVGSALFAGDEAGTGA